ncbi:hypothetical protein LP52_15010 [Streptomonospora alba]|uniref:Solute-binding protein family 5 domain-containing protein n=2 Tax=Streptomonospora alba TaxID=183763 RepID=A0A0C2JMD1_9ACTN|nr:hypothetical protein LP52_15010 [Streptomonospora alba]
MRIHAGLFEGLVRPAPDGDLRPALAEGWRIDRSGRVVTVQLRRTARWSDGRPVRSGDVAHTFLRGTDPALGLRCAWQMYVLGGARDRHQGVPGAALGVDVLDEHTVRFHLEHPLADIREFWALPAFAPLREDAPPARSPHDALAVPASGPFRYSAVDPGERIELERNPYYWDDAMPASPVRYVVGGDPVELYASGDIDLAPLEIRALDEVDPAHVTRIPEATVSYLVMNTRDDLLADSGVRAALADAIDPEELVTDTRSGAAPIGRLVPPSAGTRAYLRASPRVARRRRSGGRLDGVRLTLVCTDIRDRVAEAERLADQIRKRTGASVEIDARSYAGQYTAIREGTYHLSIASWRADYDDPLAFLAEHVSDGVAGNQSKWSDAEYNRLVAAARDEIGDAERHSRLAAAEQRLLDHDAVVPLYSWSGLWLQRPGLTGVVHRAAGASPDLRWAVRT